MITNVFEYDKQFGCNKFTMISLFIFWCIVIFKTIKKIFRILYICSLNRIGIYSAVLKFKKLFLFLSELALYNILYQFFLVKNIYYSICFLLKKKNISIYNSCKIFCEKLKKKKYSSSYESIEYSDEKTNYKQKIDFEEILVQETINNKFIPFRKTMIISGKFINNRANF
jgi:hypothetical protein